MKSFTEDCFYKGVGHSNRVFLKNLLGYTHEGGAFLCNYCSKSAKEFVQVCEKYNLGMSLTVAKIPRFFQSALIRKNIH